MNKRKRLIFTVLISMVFVMFIGCDADQQANAEEVATDTEKTSLEKELTNTEYDSVAGKYVHPQKPDSYLLLNANGTYHLTNNRRHANGGNPYTGKFSKAGSQITLQLSEKQSSRLQFKDGAVIDRKGVRWEKQ